MTTTNIDNSSQHSYTSLRKEAFFRHVSFRNSALCHPKLRMKFMVIVTTDTDAKIFSTKSLSRHKQSVTILTSLTRESMPQSYNRVSEVNLHSRETERGCRLTSHHSLRYTSLSPSLMGKIVMLSTVSKALQCEDLLL